MNKKDCEHIGYLLSTCKTRQKIEFELLKIDPRIEEERDLFEEVEGRDQATMDRYIQLMTEEYGPDWSFSKRARIEGRTKEIWQQAYNEVRA